jgi:hypothetical protein
VEPAEAVGAGAPTSVGPAEAAREDVRSSLRSSFDLDERDLEADFDLQLL